MKNVLQNSSIKIQKFLIDNNFNCTVLALPESTRTALEAARAIGCDAGQIAKSLVFIDKSSNEPILIIASGMNQVDIKKIESSTGRFLAKADGKYVKDKLGFAIGGVPPAGHKEKILTFLDPDLKLYEYLWAAAGTPFAVFQLSPVDLQKMTHGEFIDLKVETDKL